MSTLIKIKGHVPKNLLLTAIKIIKSHKPLSTTKETLEELERWTSIDYLSLDDTAMSMSMYDMYLEHPELFDTQEVEDDVYLKKEKMRVLLLNAISKGDKDSALEFCYLFDKYPNFNSATG